MSALAFDTLRYARRLKEVGVPESQAEVQAELMAEAFGFYADNLLTRDHFTEVLNARFAEQDAKIEARFAEQDAKIKARFAEQDAKIEVRFSEQEAKFEARFAEQDAKFETSLSALASRLDQRFNRQDATQRVLAWMVGLITVAVVLPQLQAWLA